MYDPMKLTRNANRSFGLARLRSAWVPFGRLVAAR